MPGPGAPTQKDERGDGDGGGGGDAGRRGAAADRHEETSSRRHHKTTFKEVSFSEAAVGGCAGAGRKRGRGDVSLVPDHCWYGAPRPRAAPGHNNQK